MLISFFLSFSYRLRVECLLLKAEFEANMGFLEPSIEAMLTAGEGKKTLTKIKMSLFEQLSDWVY